MEGLEGRALLSALHPVVAPQARAAHVGSVEPAARTSPGGAQAVLNALTGGLGSEWITLIRTRVRNLRSVVSGFMSGRLTSYSVPGITVKAPNVQPGFTGQPYDQLLPQAAGAAVFRGNVFEMGAVMRGEFRDPNTSYYVFALNRGAGATLGPRFASRPGITPDALVELTVAPFGASATGRIIDLIPGGTTQPIDPASIQIRGSTIRVFLNTKQLPSKGFPIQNYQFAFWTQTAPGNDISTVASFAPDFSMDPIAVLSRVGVRR